MDRPLWFQQLRNALRERRIAPRYAQRFMDELWCYYLDMKENEPMNRRTSEDETALLARLGNPEILAAQAEQVQYNTWSGRHPWLAFLCGPVAIFLGLWLAMACFSVACLLPLIKGETRISESWSPLPCSLLAHFQMMSVTVFVSLFLCSLLHRSNRRLGWWVLSCGLISILCMTAFIQWDIYSIKPYHGSLKVFVSIPWYSMDSLPWRLCNALVPTGIFLICAVLSRKPPVVQKGKLLSFPCSGKTRIANHLA